MMLSELCKGLPVRIVGDETAQICAVVLDSRAASPGALFAAVVNPLRNNENYLSDAVARGASAILSSRELGAGSATQVIAHDVSEILGLLSHRICGDPTRDMTLVGVTGTNGKTTFTYLMEKILEAAGEKVGVVGTVSHRFGGRTIAARNTTPEAPDLAELLRGMREDGVTAAVMEASSHGLALGRVAGCRFRVAVFTNLTRDHMDFHKDDQDYLAAKAKLFSKFIDVTHPKGAFSVINADDPVAPALIKASNARVVTYGYSEKADYRVETARTDENGIAFDVKWAGGKDTFASPLLGHFQIHNTLAAVAVCLEMGISGEIISKGLGALKNVPGRMERVPSDDLLILVDYAHTPDALMNVVGAGRRLAGGRLITIFGCGGDSDKGKRPLMAEAAASESDIIVVTSDNPRTEEPASIIEDILAGLNLSAMDWLSAAEIRPYAGHKGLHVEEDRKKAIDAAIRNARPGDLVLIAGKGHEDYQIRGREKFHLDDREEAAAAVAARNQERQSDRVIQ
jgi:UDP-N-acetylmuramoyl-L-alanyl-D-glutamate--2,6-diaminopimelate ligase